MAVTHETQMQIKEFHLDTFGHVNHATYLQILESARWDMCETHGIGLDYIHKHEIGPVILEVKIKYKKELKNRETIQIKTRCETLKDKIFVIKQSIINEKGQISAEAEITAAVFDLKERKIISPDNQWSKALGLL